MKKIILLLAIIAFQVSTGYSQKITDGTTIDLDGLSVTFNILNKESISVGNKNFDRYKVSATLVNNTGKNLGFRLNSYPQIVSNTELVELNCVNATGARQTSKRLKLKLNTHFVQATYSAMNKDGKLQNNILTVTAGYYLDNGASVKDEAIFIVPEGEEPNVTVRKTM